jgi:hypothetical protein
MGPLGAIAGTIPGAVIGYFAADYLLLKGESESDLHESRQALPLLSEAELQGASKSVVQFVRWIYRIGINLLAISIVAGGLLIAFGSEIRSLFQKSTTSVVATPQQPIQPKAIPAVVSEVKENSATKVSRAEATGSTTNDPFGGEIALAESVYPQLNPRSEKYEQTIVDMVLKRMGELQTQGRTPKIAMREAVSQIMGQLQVNQQSIAAQQANSGAVAGTIRPISVEPGVVAAVRRSSETPPEAHRLAAQALESQKEGAFEDSIRDYLAALQFRPYEQRWLLGAAVSMAAIGQLSQAAEMVQRAQTLGSVNLEIAEFLRQKGVQMDAPK